jgi:RHS repeat-associated protein
VVRRPRITNAGRGTVSSRDYVWQGGALVAAHTPDGLRHCHLDHLGSPRIITGANGTTLAQHLYFPFGEEATNSEQNAEVLKFTGHERDDLDASGSTRDLDYMHARYFSAHLGRFTTFDPVGGNLFQPQSWNRYSYVLGNPLKYVDPQGLFFESYFSNIWDFIFFDTISVTDSPLSFDPLTGVQGLNSLVLGRLALALASSDGPQIQRAADLRVFFHRAEVKQFAACVERRGTGRGEGDPEGTGFWVEEPAGRETGVFPTVVDFGRMPDGRTFTSIVLPQGATANFHTHPGDGGFGPSSYDKDLGKSMPVFILHKPTGVRVSEEGLAEAGVPVARPGWYRGLANSSVCQQYR